MWQSNNILEAPIMAAKNIKSSTNAEGPGPREHTVCWILAKDWTTVQKNTVQKGLQQVNDLQRYWYWCQSTGHITQIIFY